MDGGAWWVKSLGLWRVGHDWATSLSLFTLMHWRRKWQHTPVFLPGESQGRRGLVGCRLWGRTRLKRLSSSILVPEPAHSDHPVLILARNFTFGHLSYAFIFIDHHNLDWYFNSYLLMGFPGGSDGKGSAYNAGDLGSVPRSGRSPAARKSNPV